MTTVCTVVTTVATQAQAQALGEALLGKGLAACVQYEEIRSQYVWQGALHCEAEVRVTAKTLPACFVQVEALIVARHPYECAQILRQDWQASSAYAAWVASCVDVSK